jgi:hypothetical protein
MAWQERACRWSSSAAIEYGAGSSRDWAAKGTALLGVKAVIAESFERIHRSNLVGMGVIPFEFTGGDSRKTLGLKGDETFDIKGLSGDLKPLSEVPCTITRADGSQTTITLKCRIDTENRGGLPSSMAACFCTYVVCATSPCHVAPLSWPLRDNCVSPRALRNPALRLPQSASTHCFRSRLAKPLALTAGAG